MRLADRNHRIQPDRLHGASASPPPPSEAPCPGKSYSDFPSSRDNKNVSTLPSRLMAAFALSRDIISLVMTACCWACRFKMLADFFSAYATWVQTPTTAQHAKMVAKPKLDMKTGSCFLPSLSWYHCSQSSQVAFWLAFPGSFLHDLPAARCSTCGSV